MPANTDYLFTVPTRSGQFSVLTDGQTISPSYAFSSESSLGFYRSAASTVALSHGTLSLPGALAVTGDITVTGDVRADQFSTSSTGQSVSPTYATSEASLGFYRSAASTLAVSYGTFAPSNISATGGIIAASAFTSAGTVKSADVWTSRLSVGGSSSAYTGTAMLAFSYISTLGTIMLVNGSSSSETIFVWPAVRPGDWIGVTVGTGVGISSLSSGLVYHSHCTVAGQCEVRISNASTLIQNQTAQTLSFYRISTA
jgi:hypothetical protein